jgi:hypothetical protein
MKISPPPGYDRLTIQLVTNRYTDRSMESECIVNGRIHRYIHFSTYLKIHTP